ncbi:tripartite tricarboxylate transporter TctB family protein [Pseudonocardia cypriaca]|uniref:Tripartite tricarboxylate transporter TctB family protein n=1 Tax=Pseudonocardia cypriaca TaxID=882449 RepID=A0A543GH04_9PSEU|nr:tripartite tricarboxylate transporter TctB family protein [Pseudonocardia cypriaca]TQM45335.1 tripartite tricarboxylate transporter TctB family protein [Pseudonocardia cypriaca]
MNDRLADAVHEVEEAEHEFRPPVAGRVTDVVVGIAVVALGVAALLGSLALGVGSPRAPGTGTWPFLVSIVLVVLGLGLLVMTGRTRDAERFTGAGGLVLAGLATMIAFVAVISVIGFEIPAALLMFVWLKFLGGESWRFSVVTSLATVAAFYVVFVGLLAVPIPHMF